MHADTESNTSSVAHTSAGNTRKDCTFHGDALHKTGRKEDTIHKMEQLGREINESRLNISRELNAMNDEGIITLRRSEICFPQLERLILTAGAEQQDNL